jgi:hypothetical protein
LARGMSSVLARCSDSRQKPFLLSSVADRFTFVDVCEIGMPFPNLGFSVNVLLGYPAETGRRSHELTMLHADCAGIYCGFPLATADTTYTFINTSRPCVIHLSQQCWSL